MEKTLVYACRTKDREVLAHSSSGGAFTAISDCFLERGDAVLCSSYDYDGHRARFGMVFTKQERNSARGSMYMQSYALDSWKESLEWLRENPDRKLLFTGTGCQASEEADQKICNRP
jgi:coenzyme F420-reducing hydrogenase beta subunit